MKKKWLLTSSSVYPQVEPALVLRPRLGKSVIVWEKQRIPLFSIQVENLWIRCFRGSKIQWSIQPNIYFCRRQNRNLWLHFFLHVPFVWAEATFFIIIFLFTIRKGKFTRWNWLKFTACANERIPSNFPWNWVYRISWFQLRLYPKPKTWHYTFLVMLIRISCGKREIVGRWLSELVWVRKLFLRDDLQKRKNYHGKFSHLSLKRCK